MERHAGAFREVDAALVPLENSVEGSVSQTLDELASGDPLVIIDEAAIRVEFALMARPGTALSETILELELELLSGPDAALQWRNQTSFERAWPPSNQWQW